MPSYDENIDHDNLRQPDWRLFLRGFRAAFFRTKLWVATWLFLLLLSLVPAFQTAAFFKGAVGNRYPSAELARDLHSSLQAPSTGLGAVFRQDHAAGLSVLNGGVASSGGGDHRLRPAIRSCTLDLDDPVILAERYEVEENSVHAALPGALERSLQTTFAFLPERSETSPQS